MTLDNIYKRCTYFWTVTYSYFGLQGLSALEVGNK